eukprot:30956-Pelagococcus_subviridis.AAC.2
MDQRSSASSSTSSPPPLSRPNHSSPRTTSLLRSVTGRPACGHSCGKINSRPLTGRTSASAAASLAPTAPHSDLTSRRSAVSPPRSHVRRYSKNVCVVRVTSAAASAFVAFEKKPKPLTPRESSGSTAFGKSTCGAMTPPIFGYRKSRICG